VAFAEANVVFSRRVPMGAVNVWEVETSTEFEAARGRSPQARLTARHRDISKGAGILPAGPPYRFCDLTWFPRLLCDGERRRFTLYQVRGLEGLTNGVYGTSAPDPTIKVILQRGFGDLA
jgi:hypothetical protein